LNKVISFFSFYARTFWEEIKYILSPNLRYQPAVEQYPDAISARMENDLFPKTKGFLRNDLSICTGCGDCLRVCTVDALDMKATTGKDGAVVIDEFTVDLGKCYACSVCVEICPVSSITHTKEHELAADDLKKLEKIYVKEVIRTKLDFLKENKKIRSYEVRR